MGSKQSQFALPSNNLDKCATIAQHNLALVILCYKPDFFETILESSHPPDLCSEFITRSHWGGEACLELSQVLRITATELLQKSMCSAVPAK